MTTNDQLSEALDPIDGAITVGWTVAHPGNGALLMCGWKMRVEAEKRWPDEYAGAGQNVWIPLARARFDSVVIGEAVVCYSDEDNAKEAARATGGRVMPVRSQPGEIVGSL